MNLRVSVVMNKEDTASLFELVNGQPGEGGGLPPTFALLAMMLCASPQLGQVTGVGGERLQGA